MKRIIFILIIIFNSVSIISCSEEYTHRSDEPLTVAEAATRIPNFPFPPSADSIYYLTFAGGMQVFEQYIRFDLNEVDLESTIEDIIKWHNKITSNTHDYPQVPISEVNISSPREAFKPIPWWNLTDIRVGYCIGHSGSSYRIYVDQEHSRIYFNQTD